MSSDCSDARRVLEIAADIKFEIRPELPVYCVLCSDALQFPACVDVLDRNISSKKEVCFLDEILCPKNKTQNFFLDALFWTGKECLKSKVIQKYGFG